MPELPEVETVVKELNQSNIIGLSIAETDVLWPKTVGDLSTKEFSRILQHQSIKSISRRAKFIVFELTNTYMLIHLRMTGKLLLTSKKTSHSPHERVVFTLSNGQDLRFIDTRKFGRITLAQSLLQYFEGLGPEPLDSSFTWQKLKEILKNRSTQLKALLLNQNIIAGIGNIYADEALWLAKLHPLRKSNSLSDKEIQALFRGIQEALEAGIQSNGATLGSGKTNFYRLDGSRGHHIYELSVFRQTGKKCPRCETLIERIKAAGRSTHICTKCQQLF